MSDERGFEIAGLWIGPILGTLHRLCLRSWVRLGFHSVVFTDSTIPNVPEGVEVRSIFEVPGVEDIYLKHKIVKNPSGFSNIFRAKLLMSEPVVWLDTDVLAIQVAPLNFDSHLFGYESHKTVNGAVLALPRTSPALRELHNRLLSAKDTKIIFGDLGPRLLTKVLKDQNMLGMASPKSEFYEIRPTELWKLYSAEHTEEIARRLTGKPLVHLWNEATKFIPFNLAELAPQRGSFLHEVDPEFWQIENYVAVSAGQLDSWKGASKTIARRNHYSKIFPESLRRATLSLMGRRIEAGY